MSATIRTLVASLAVAGALVTTAEAQEPKHGGIIKIYHRDSPGASIHEEATYSTNVPFMSVFNNLVEYKQDVPQNSMDTIVPDLATSWSWSADNNQQSQETDLEKRKRLAWDIDQKIQNDVARPIIFHTRAATCWQPYVHGFTPMVNSSYNGYRFEDLWLDR